MCIIMLPMTSARAPSTTTSRMTTGAISTLVAVGGNRKKYHEFKVNTIIVKRVFVVVVVNRAVENVQ